MCFLARRCLLVSFFSLEDWNEIVDGMVGMAKAGPDTLGENQGGFDSADGMVYGFSHMHDSGTGGSVSVHC